MTNKYDNISDEVLVTLIETAQSAAEFSNQEASQAQSELLRRHNETLKKLLEEKPAPYGVVRHTMFEADGHAFEIEYTVPKTVKWDEQKLKEKEAEIREDWGDDPAEYITKKESVTYTVSEDKYNAWPGKVQKEFADARTVKPGTPKMKIVKKEIK